LPQSYDHPQSDPSSTDVASVITIAVTAAVVTIAFAVDFAFPVTVAIPVAVVVAMAIVFAINIHFAFTNAVVAAVPITLTGISHRHRHHRCFCRRRGHLLFTGWLLR
jgi:hypothetical protein